MSRFWIVVLVVVAVLLLAGCGDPAIAERVANRDECEQAGGTYTEWYDVGFQWECDLSTVTP